MGISKMKRGGSCRKREKKKKKKRERTGYLYGRCEQTIRQHTIRKWQLSAVDSAI